MNWNCQENELSLLQRTNRRRMWSVSLRPVRALKVSVDFRQKNMSWSSKPSLKSLISVHCTAASQFSKQHVHWYRLRWDNSAHNAFIWPPVLPLDALVDALTVKVWKSLLTSFLSYCIHNIFRKIEVTEIWTCPTFLVEARVLWISESYLASYSCYCIHKSIHKSSLLQLRCKKWSCCWCDCSTCLLSSDTKLTLSRKAGSLCSSTLEKLKGFTCGAEPSVVSSITREETETADAGQESSDWSPRCATGQPETTHRLQHAEREHEGEEEDDKEKADLGLAAAKQVCKK